MEITELNQIRDFGAGVNCLRNPSLISQNFPFSGNFDFPQVYSFCKWGAVILAILATSVGLIARIKELFLRICRMKLISSTAEESIKLLNDDDFDDFDEDDDVGDDSCSLVESDDEGYEMTLFGGKGDSSEEENSVAGRQFSWSDFAAGKSVVKLWDSLTSGFSCEDESVDDVVSVWDFGGDDGFTGAECRDPMVVLSAEKARNGGVLLGVYDNRVEGKDPAISAEWPLRRRAVAGVNSSDGVGSVYVRDDVTGALTVGDLRNVKSPLLGPTVSGASTW